MRTSGHVAHCAPGAILLTPQAAALLAEHLGDRRLPDKPAARLVVADLVRLSRPGRESRDKLTLASLVARHSTLSTNEAAEYLGITPAGVRKKIERGHLPATFDGKRWRINPTDLDRGRT